MTEMDDIFLLFADAAPKAYHTRDTSHGKADFREIIFATYEEGALPAQLHNRLVIKLADNGFTDDAHLLMWERLALEYRKRGFYCPAFVRTKRNEYPVVPYRGRRCRVYAEEFSPYKTADSFENVTADGKYRYLDAALRMNAEIAAAHFDFSKLPSGYAMFDVFDPADSVDEVMENARAWLTCAQGFPRRFQAQVRRIWERWCANQAYLQSRYDELPTSIFQADLNSTNVLLKENGDFAGVLDFNIAGKDAFINYLFREIPYIFGSGNRPPEEEGLSIRAENDSATARILYAIGVVKASYAFSDIERELALPLYRCIRPLWYTSVDAFRKAQSEDDMRRLLDETEQIQTMEIDFPGLMR